MSIDFEREAFFMNGRFKRAAAAALTVCMMPLGSFFALPASANTEDCPYFGYMGSVGGLSEVDVIDAAEQVYLQLKECSDRITITLPGKLNTEEKQKAALKIFREVAQNYDVALLVDGSAGFSYSLDGSDYVAFDTPYFDEYKDVDKQSARAELEQILDEIEEGVQETWTPQEVALYFHDYISVNFDYDQKGVYLDYVNQQSGEYSKHYVYQFLDDDHEAVCDAYASLYSYLINKVSLDGKIHIQSTKIVSEPNYHAWNAVRVGDTYWYYVDVTHDDSYHGYRPGLVLHDYFLNTADEMLEIRQEKAEEQARLTNSQEVEAWSIGDWKLLCGNSADQTLNCVGSNPPVTPIDGFWKNVNTAIEPIGTEWLVTDYTNTKNTYNGALTSELRTVSICDISGNKTEIYRDPTNGLWNGYPDTYMVPVYADNLVFLTEGKTVLCLYNNKIFETQYGTTAYNAYNVAQSDHLIYGLKKKGDKLEYYYTVDDSPNANYDWSNGNPDQWGYDNPGLPVEIDYKSILEDFRKQCKGEASWKVTYKDTNDDIVCVDEMDGFSTPTINWFLLSVTRIDGIDSEYKRVSYPYKGYTDKELTNEYDFTKVVKEDTTIYGEYYRCVPVGNSATAGGNIKMNYFLDMNKALYDKADAKAQFTVKNGDEQRVVTKSLSEAVKITAENAKDYGVDNDKIGKYVISVEVYAREMDAEITAEVVIPNYQSINITSDNAKTVNAYLKTVSESIDESASNEEKKLKELVAAAQTYGEAANALFDGGEAVNVADVQLTDNYNAAKSGEAPNGVEFLGSTLVLEDTTAIRHYFRTAEELSFETNNQEGLTFSSKKVAGIDDIWCYEFSGYAPELLDTTVSFTLKDTSFNITCSPCSYIASVLNDDQCDDNIKNTMKALYAYHTAAKAYAAAA